MGPDMLSAIRLARTLARRAALDDLMVAMTITTWALHLLRLSATDARERRFAGKLVLLLEDARELVEHL